MNKRLTMRTIIHKITGKHPKKLVHASEITESHLLKNGFIGVINKQSHTPRKTDKYSMIYVTGNKKNTVPKTKRQIPNMLWFTRLDDVKQIEPALRKFIKNKLPTHWENFEINIKTPKKSHLFRY